MNIEGHIDFGFEPLAECFADILRDAEQRGAALCVQVGGETVTGIDIFGFGETLHHNRYLGGRARPSWRDCVAGEYIG